MAYYEEKGQELDKALQIFIRMNDGGTPLSHSDLLLSIAVAQWKEHDARREIHSLVDELNNIGSGFGFSKDLILKGGLMLSDIGSVGFKVDNFNRVNMDTFERNWDAIKRAMSLTVQLVSTFGFSGQNLTADNALLPIAYYLYRKNPGDAYLSHSRFNQDRESIREWLVLKPFEERCMGKWVGHPPHGSEARCKRRRCRRIPRDTCSRGNGKAGSAVGV